MKPFGPGKSRNYFMMVSNMCCDKYACFISIYIYMYMKKTLKCIQACYNQNSDATCPEIPEPGRRTQAIVAGSSTLSRTSAKQPYLPGKSVQVCCCDLATVELKSMRKLFVMFPSLSSLRCNTLQSF